jgi:hypothetical protein
MAQAEISMCLGECGRTRGDVHHHNYIGLPTPMEIDRLTQPAENDRKVDTIHVSIKIRGCNAVIDIDISKNQYITETLSMKLKHRLGNGIRAILCNGELIKRFDTFASIGIDTRPEIEVVASNVHCGGNGTTRCTMCLKWTPDGKMCRGVAICRGCRHDGNIKVSGPDGLSRDTVQEEIDRKEELARKREEVQEVEAQKTLKNLSTERQQEFRDYIANRWKAQEEDQIYNPWLCSLYWQLFDYQEKLDKEMNANSRKREAEMKEDVQLENVQRVVGSRLQPVSCACCGENVPFGKRCCGIYAVQTDQT